jgi:hypothetical protein
MLAELLRFQDMIKVGEFGSLTGSQPWLRKAAGSRSNADSGSSNN